MKSSRALAPIALMAALALTGCGSTTPEEPSPPSGAITIETESPRISTESAEATESPEASETSETTPTETALGAQEVEAAILEGNGVDSFQSLEATSPGYLISEIEDVSAGAIRVHLQDMLTETEQADIATWVVNMSCTEVSGLDTVVTRDASGIDQNNYTRSLEVLPACQ
ncbi:hypothetical protein [Citricoccus sp. K5]|uniref:hypothetical protein n=1 Tax=Citricoccus sp. K5 TaxID=2653135 RepID=UPI0012F38751|nr:hypothetical protein [Citricoccus sp. K5]VXB23487.1 conserved exported hypothetical protein [Citricoccus sp. K5]